MLLSIKTRLLYTAPQPCSVLLQIEPGGDDTQICRDARFLLMSGTDLRQMPGEDGIGLRRWVSVGTQLDCQYETQASVTRANPELSALSETPKAQLPDTAIGYLMPSRYCQSDLFLDFTASEFGGLSGGALVLAMRDWIADRFSYDNTASNAGTTATDSFSSLSGVCRDYAHVLIAFVRAAGIPARFVSAYGPDVTPQDLHAVVEVYLDGAWHLVDATGMAEASEIVRICIGRDAADASFLTSYGALDLQEQSVEVTRIPD